MTKHGTPQSEPQQLEQKLKRWKRAFPDAVGLWLYPAMRDGIQKIRVVPVDAKGIPVRQRLLKKPQVMIEMLQDIAPYGHDKPHYHPFNRHSIHFTKTHSRGNPDDTDEIETTDPTDDADPNDE